MNYKKKLLFNFPTRDSRNVTITFDLILCLTVFTHFLFHPLYHVKWMETSLVITFLPWLYPSWLRVDSTAS